MEQEPIYMPYWIWACSRSKHSDNRNLTLGELFVLLLDRLEEHGVNNDGVVVAFAQLAEEAESGEAASLRRFAELLRSRRTEKEYEELEALSRTLFRTIGSAAASKDLAPFAARLAPAVKETADHFKDTVLRGYVSYFMQDARKDPARLGYIVYSLHLLESAAERMRFQEEPAMTEAVVEPVRFPEIMLCELLDWTGNYEELDYYFWRRELNDIMGMENR